MGKCSYYHYDNGDRCKLLADSDSDKVDSYQYNEFCRYEYEYEKCPHYLAWKKSGKSSSDSGCYLTTACITAKGLPDDCYELETLRKFRDNWLKHQPGGEEIVAEYYRLAPEIIRNVEKSGKSESVFKALYEKLVSPCVQYIEEGKPNEALSLYQETTRKLADQYLPSAS